MSRRGIAGTVLAALILSWLAGFCWFSIDAARSVATIPNADGIVVLTGGTGRIETAIRLLRDGHARLMLISGVPEGVALNQLLLASTVNDTLEPELARRVMLGHAATSTIGNAIETASWARANGLHTLIVVTAGYHMRRAMFEIGSALPDARLYPDPVQPPALARWNRHTLRLLASEYTKWLVVISGLTGSAHLRETA